MTSSLPPTVEAKKPTDQNSFRQYTFLIQGNRLRRERCRTDGGMIGRETVQSEQLLPTRAKHAPAPRLTSAAGEGVMAIHMTVPAIQRRGKKARRAMPRGRIG